jgi:hypothetical protein
MEDYAEMKAVEIEWNVLEAQLFAVYAAQHWQQYNYTNNAFTGPEQYLYHVRSME